MCVPKGAHHPPLRWCLKSTRSREFLFHHLRGEHKAPTIAKLLRSEGLSARKQGVAEFLKWYESRGTIKRKPGSRRPSKVTAEVKRTVEEQMRLDDETTATQLHALLNCRGNSLSLRTILRCRTSRGWTFGAVRTVNSSGMLTK